MPPTTLEPTTPPPATSKPEITHPTSPPHKPEPHSPIPAWVQPDLPRLLRIEHNQKDSTTHSTSLVSLPPGALFARITTATPSARAYSTVQASRGLHVELNSDLLYTDHSCRPSLVFDMQRWEVRVSDEAGLKVGDVLTFFYPSTEWDMATPFDCRCGVDKCVGRVGGARGLDGAVLGRYWLNRHIVDLLREEGRWGDGR